MPEFPVEAVENGRYEEPGLRQHEVNYRPSARDGRALDLPPLIVLGDLSVTHLAEDLLNRGLDAVRVLLAGENRVLMVEVIHVVDIVLIPPVGGGKRGRAREVVQDELDLGPHTIIHRHFCASFRLLIASTK